jgi:hypothetical protein
VAGDTLDLEFLVDPAVPLSGTIRTIRRWDNPWNPDRSDLTLQNIGSDYMQGGRLLLECDLTIQFASEDEQGQECTYQTGDFWLIPVRIASGLDQWEEGHAQPPGGEVHAYAPLAAVKVQADGTVADPTFELRDLRHVFPTLRSLVRGAASIVQGTGEIHRVPKWQATDGAELLNSNITDDGTSVTIDGQGLMVRGTLGLRSGAIIEEFSTDDTLSDRSDSSVPTERAVKEYVDNLLTGSVAAFAMQTPPAGWLECNGQQLNREAYSRLFSKIGVTFGSGNGLDTFNVPDLRGEFIRGWDHGRGIDPARSLGQHQDDQVQSHKHSDSGHSHSDSGHAHGYLDRYTPESGVRYAPGGERPVQWENDFYRESYSGHASINTGYANLGAPSDARHGSETRPRNVALLYCIKF